MRVALGAAAALAVLPLVGVGALFLAAPGRCSRDPRSARPSADAVLLIDRQLPRFDATLVCHITVEAPPPVVYAAISETNLLDPVVRGLFLMRELPNRLHAWERGVPQPGFPQSVTFGDFLKLEPGPAVLAEEEGVEIVIGSVGRFWERDYGPRSVAAAEFAGFSEPGYAKLAMSFRVEPHGEGRSLLRYEARTATTDSAAHRTFGRYWRVIRPGVALVMRRALGLIRTEAQQRTWQQAARYESP